MCDPSRLAARRNHMSSTLSAAATALLTLTFALSPAVTEPFMGYRADQLPNPIPNPLIQPAGIAFSIWGIIYSWLVISALYGWVKRRDDPAWTPVRLRLLPALAIGTAWLWVANQSAIWGTVTIIAMAASAIAALRATPVGLDRWTLRSPIAIFAGWLTAACHVSATVTLAGYGAFLSEATWTYLGLGSALVIGLATQIKRPGAPEYGLTLIWALAWIVLDVRMASGPIAVAALIAAASIGALLLWQQSRKERFLFT